MHPRFTLLTSTVLLCAATAAAPQEHAHPGTSAARDTTIARKLGATAAELRLAGGDLHVINLYKLQAEALRATAGAPADSTIARLVRDVHAPYAEFWAGYLGDEAAFRRWAVKLLEPEHPIHDRLEPLLDVALDHRFTEGVQWIEQTTGRRPRGTWYIVFGPAWTDMGGLGAIGMVADFSRLRPDSTAIANLLPHELTHQVHGDAAGRADDPDRGTVLERIIGEGFATYVAWVHGAGRRSEARSLGYTDDEWAWALAHERELFDAVRPIIASREREDNDRVAARSVQLIPGSPGAAGYFLGLRIVQAYVARHGPDSWQEIYDLPVGVVLERVGTGVFTRRSDSPRRSQSSLLRNSRRVNTPVPLLVARPGRLPAAMTGRRSRREASPPPGVDGHVLGVGDALRSTRVPQERSDEDCPSLE